MAKPILYKSTETAFDTNGIGILADAIKCTVQEELNGIFELELQYPLDGIHYADIQLRSLIVAKPNPVDDPQPFRVYRITKPMNGVVTVYAQHISYDLSGIPVQPFSAGSAPATMAALKSNAVVACPFDLWTDKQTAAQMNVTAPASIRSLLGGVHGSVLDTYGGQYKFDRYLVRLYGRRGADRGVTIRYGKNLTSLQQEENCAGVYTGVYPYWAGSDSSSLVTLPEKTVAAPGTYDFTRILTVDFSSEWTEPPTVDQLRARAQRYVQENAVGVPKVSLDISFAQLEQTEEYRHLALLERVELGDTVTVQFPRLGVDAAATVRKTNYDVLLERYDSVELGDARANIADTIAGQAQEIAQAPTKSYLQNAVDNATALITGNNGGYVLLHSSTGAKQPDEILIMNTPDITTATQVWRWNKAGLGYSKNGYNGPYALAMTQDGQIVADFITAGTMNANMVRAGVLQSNDGDVSFDLNNAQINMKSIGTAGQTIRMLLRYASLQLLSAYGGEEKTAVQLATSNASNSGGITLFVNGVQCAELRSHEDGGRLLIGDDEGKIKTILAISESTKMPYIALRDGNQKVRMRFSMLDANGRPSIQLLNSAGETIWQVYENTSGTASVYQKS